MAVKYDLEMLESVEAQSVSARPLAVVRCRVRPDEVGAAWGPAISKVWDVVRARPGLWAGGHNIFLYHHAKEAGASLRCDFGVEVTGPFDAEGEVFATQTPAGEAVVAVYRGPYDGLHEAYDAIGTWMTTHSRRSGRHWWEIYGDPTPDPADTVTTVLHLLN